MDSFLHIYAPPQVPGWAEQEMVQRIERAGPPKNFSTFRGRERGGAL